MSTAKKQRTTGAAADDTPKASSTPDHPWVKLMNEHNMTLEEVAKHTFKVHAFEPENQNQLEQPTRLKADAPSKPVKKPVKKPISVFLKEETEVQTFDYLVVAANPRELMGYGLSTLDGSPDEPIPKQVLAPTLKEEAIYGKASGMHNSYFQTTVIKVPPPKDPKPQHIVLFSPKINANAVGEVMGYRNETRLALFHETLKEGETVNQEYLTVYQISDPAKTNPNPSDPKCEAIDKVGLQKIFNKFIKKANQKDVSWFPYEVPKQEPLVFHTPYFNRFTPSSLNKGLLWDLLDIQGQNYTTFTHGSSCFESVLQIYQYLEMLKTKGSLPTDKTASVAIVGAGPSGLLSALFLVRMGVKKITIFEKNQDPEKDEKLGHLYAGKTRTVKHELDAETEVVCEMGTCYLSPAYELMVKDLKHYFDGEMYTVDGNVYPEPPILLSSASEFEPAFRAMEPEGQFADGGPIMRYADLLGGGLTVPAGGSGIAGLTFKDNGVTHVKQPINFGEYIILKAMEDTCHGPPEHNPFGGKVSHLEAKILYDVERLKCTGLLAADLLKYICLHKKIFGNSTPFPAERMSPAHMKPLTIPFDEWLTLHDLTRIKPFFQYAYSVQGYGSLGHISAFYVLVWIVPSVLAYAGYDIISSALQAHPDLLEHLDWFKQELKKLGVQVGSKGVVFALKEGWGQVWVNMRKHLVHKGVEFKWSAELERIERDGVKTAK